MQIGAHNGVWLVDLAPLNDPALVPQAVALALGIREVPDRPLLATLIETLRSRDLLLLLDNCEHLLDACARLVDALLHSCAQVRVLATSREMLGVRGETTFRAPSLALPDFTPGIALHELRLNESIQLFVDRARAVEPQFDLTAENAATMVRICQRLDGIPLAIELAATRVRVLTADQIAARLDNRFRLLTGGSRTALRRQQTLRTLVDWSHDLLSPEERVLFRRLAVFAGGWSLEAAESVCSGAGLVVDDVLDLLSGLVDKSMVVCESQSGGKRYHFLETIRTYAGEQLLAVAGEAELLRNRHRDWCLALAERAEPELFGPASRAWIARLTREYPNLRGALEWCLETDPDTGLRLAGSLWPFWYLDVNGAEGIRWLGPLLAQAPDSSPARGKALLGAGHCARRMSTLGQSRSWTEESLAIARAVGDRRLAGRALFHLGNILTMQQDYAGAQAVLEESGGVFREVGDRLWEGMAWRDLGHLARLAGDYGRAATLYEASLAILRSIGHRWNIFLTLLATGYLARQRGDPERGRAAYQECLSIARDDSDPFRFIALRSIGELERASGNFEEADAYFREGLLEVQKTTSTRYTTLWLYSFATLLLQRGFWERGTRLAAAAQLETPDPVNTLPSDVADHEDALLAAHTALGDPAFAAAWAKGRALTMEQAVAFALDEDSG